MHHFWKQGDDNRIKFVITLVRLLNGRLAVWLSAVFLCLSLAYSVVTVSAARQKKLALFFYECSSLLSVRRIAKTLITSPRPDRAAFHPIFSSWLELYPSPLQPRNLWSQYCNEETLLGLSFSSETNYMLLDIDRKSDNHPKNDQERYDGIEESMESIGLCRPVPILSSDSDGIHQYYFCPRPYIPLP